MVPSRRILKANYSVIPALQASDSLRDEESGAYKKILHVNILLVDQVIWPWADRAAGQNACCKPTSFRWMQLLGNVGLSGHAAVECFLSSSLNEALGFRKLSAGGAHPLSS